MSKVTYTGRLAYVEETGFHHEMTDGIVNVPVQLEDGTWGNEERKALVPGERVLTEDGGKTWRYAGESDTPHNDRYHERTVTVDSTENELLRLSLEHGREKAATLVDPHHFAVQPDDAHFEGIRSDPDAIAASITSHTEAYR